jgi:hypothetical protein
LRLCNARFKPNPIERGLSEAQAESGAEKPAFERDARFRHGL